MGARGLVIMERINDDAGVGGGDTEGVRKMNVEKIMPHDSSIVMFAKMAIAGNPAGHEKSDFFEAINKRSTELYGDSSPRSFTKTIVDDDVGKLLYKALKVSPGSDRRRRSTGAPNSSRR
jgi:hypothetical protein